MFFALAAAAAYSQDQPASPAQPAASAPEQNPTPPPAAEPAVAGPREGSGTAPLRVMVDHSMLLKLPAGRASRVVVTDPAVATAMPLSPGNQILVNGLAAGEVSLIVWDELGRGPKALTFGSMSTSPPARKKKSVFFRMSGLRSPLPAPRSFFPATFPPKMSWTAPDRLRPHTPKT